MSCLYPENTGRTAYAKGCRCVRCSTVKMESRSEERKRLAARQPSQRFPIPATAVARVIHEWLAKQETGVGPRAWRQLAERAGLRNIERGVWRLENEVQWTSFETADRLVSAIDPSLWHTDPELAEALASLPAGAVDEHDDGGLLTDDEIRQWAIDTRESMTPSGWEGLRKSLAWFAPDLPELEAA